MHADARSDIVAYLAVVSSTVVLADSRPVAWFAPASYTHILAQTVPSEPPTMPRTMSETHDLGKTCKLDDTLFDRLRTLWSTLTVDVPYSVRLQ